MNNQLFFMLSCCCCTFLFVTWKTYHSKLWGSAWEDNFDSSVIRLLQCTQLRKKYASLKVLQLRNTPKFLNEMTQLMSCPWKPNITQKERYRVELYTSCNATEDLILTKQNTVLGQNITNDGDWYSCLVDNSLLEMLPESTPWRTGGQLGRCAVVGNGGILKNSSCGSQINNADFVIRLNLAPINVSTDVGNKTNLITANPTQIRRSYPDLMNQPKPLADTVSKYREAHILLPAFAYRSCTAISFQVHQALRPLCPQQKVVFFNPNYLRGLHRYWRQRGHWALRLSTGLMLASVALELCEEVHLYGFWPFKVDLSQQQLSHHYYDDVKPRPGSHSMSWEFLHLVRMHSMGAINLHIGKCN